MRTTAIFCFLFFCATLSQSSFASNIEDKYLKAFGPRRIALLVGNSDYSDLTPIPSVKKDLSEMEVSLKELKFDIVVVHPNVKTRKEFQYDVLVPFRKLVEPDDLILIYYSGHGFSYGLGHYLVPTNSPETLLESQVNDVAIPVDSLLDFFMDERPGALVLVMDACRSIASNVVKDAEGNNVAKGPIAAPSISLPGKPQYVATYAVEPGRAAAGSTDANEMSTYTRALVEQLKNTAKEDYSTDDLTELHSKVTFQVDSETDQKQRPGLIQSGWVKVYIQSNSNLLQLQYEVWLSALKSGHRKTIEQFAKFYSLSPFLKSARLWLQDNPQAKGTDYSQVAPAAVEAAWQQPSARVLPAKAIKTSFAFPRTDSLKASDIQNSRFDARSSDFDWGIFFGDIDSAVGAQKLDTWAEKMAGRVQTDTFSSTNVFLEPNQNSSTVAVLRPNTAVSLDSWISAGPPPEITTQEVVTTRQCDYGTLFDFPCFEFSNRIEVRKLTITDPSWEPTTWAKVSIPGSDIRGYVPINSSAVNQPLEIGYPHKEFILDIDNTHNSIAKMSIELQNYIEEKKNQISWVSLSTNSPLDESVNANGELATFEQNIRLLHATKLIEELGIPRERITGLSDDSSSPTNRVRVRIFHFSAPNGG